MNYPQPTLVGWGFLAKDKNDDMHTPGVYFLFGLDNESEKRFVYVGEGDDVLKRIVQPHGFEKDDSYWTEAVIFVTPDGTLDKAKIKYLENRFHSIVVDSGRYIVKNGNTPKQSPVQQKIQDMLERFIMNSQLVILDRIVQMMDALEKNILVN